MTMMEAVKSCFRNFATFSGRARRAEYWKFFMFNSLVSFLCLLLGALLSAASSSMKTGSAFMSLMGLYSLAAVLPGLAVTCRRLHDLGKSGACIFFILLPVIGEILLLVWEFQDGQPFTNQYGPDPKGRRLGADGVYYPPAPAAAAAKEERKEEPVSVAKALPEKTAEKPEQPRSAVKGMASVRSSVAEKPEQKLTVDDLKAKARETGIKVCEKSIEIASAVSEKAKSKAAPAERPAALKVSEPSDDRSSGSSAAPATAEKPVVSTESAAAPAVENRMESRIKSRGFSAPDDLD